MVFAVLFTVGYKYALYQVARIQLMILNEMGNLPSDPSVDEAIRILNGSLMDITTLYGQFADEFDLHECKLAILHCAGHYDSGLVETLWRNIIKSGMIVRPTPVAHLCESFKSGILYNQTLLIVLCLC